MYGIPVKPAKIPISSPSSKASGTGVFSTNSIKAIWKSSFGVFDNARSGWSFVIPRGPLGTDETSIEMQSRPAKYKRFASIS
ncbi:hypothetical protein LMH87_002222 [Akanthomyces muscarius]|uniref:Uncharacterized protein n=1 Tax=Akanthomyces muscarius TaxID=2231603 RepID=A0A9W8UJ65_AKAMU|nr:hypothetical protein LMH87_002222 [Akanthomyces muscarius]KAJ4147714.1 hypothetical protein LMH87_002222 [Akanthomyces muscarius]